MKPIAHLCRLFMALALVLLASGCATATLDNVPTCEVAEKDRKAYVNSMVGWLGVTFKLTDRSARVMCPDAPAKETKP